MIRIGDIYKANRTDNSKMLSDFTIPEQDVDFWAEYRTNYARYDSVFNRMFNSFWPFMQQDMELSDAVSAFRDDVYNHLLINAKKYDELFRVQVIPDEDYSLINNYDMQEIMDKDVTDNQDNTYGQRQDSGSYTKGSRQDSTGTTTGEQTTTNSHKVAPYDSSTYAEDNQDSTVAGQRIDSVNFTEGQQLDSSSNTKGSQKDDLDRTYTEDYTLHRVGNIGVQTVSDMLAKHIKVWSMWEFYEYIFKEISKDLLLL